MAHLTDAEVARYRDRGYVIPAFRLAEARIAALRTTLEALIRANPDVRPERLVNVHIEGRNPEGLQGSADFLALAADPDILDLVEQIIGPDVILWACAIFCKPGGDGLEVPWHQDGHYWPIRPLATCTVWIALDRSDTGNGCMRVIPGSHRSRDLHSHLTEERPDRAFTQRVADDAFDPAAAADIVLDPGQMSLHDVYLIHGSAPNRSARRRAGVAIRYMPGTSVFERTLMGPTTATGIRVDWSTRPLWLLRGIDRTGRNDFAVGHRPDGGGSAPAVSSS